MIPIRILFVDDHKLFRESVVRLLNREPDFTICGQCGTLSEAERIVKANPIDLVLLDYDLGAEIGTTIIGSLLWMQPNLQIVIVTGGMSTNAILAAVNDGVSGIVLKHSDPNRLIEAIRKIAFGEKWWDDGILHLMAGASTKKFSPPSSRPITERQRQVLQLILDGFTNKEIAAKLSSSESSVKASIQELFTKAGVRTRSQLVRIAVEKHTSDWFKT